MKKLFSQTKVLMSLVAMLTYATSFAQPGAPSGKSWVPVNELTDEFNNGFNSNKWMKRSHVNWLGRKPSQFNPNNVNFGGGNLQIKGTLRFPNRQGNFIWTGIMSSTKPLFTKGMYTEARVKNADMAIVSSFWTQGNYSEIDVIENWGEVKNPNCANGSCRNLPTTMEMNTHYFPQPCGFKCDRTTQKHFNDGTRNSANFNLYGVWFKDSRNIQWFKNKKPVASVRLNYDFNEGQHVIFDMETFTWGPGLPSNSDLNNNNKNTVYYDWVHTYRLVNGSGGNQGGTTGGNNGGGSANPPSSAGAPIGKTIWLRKSGGDRKFVTVTNNDSQLAASANAANAAAQQFVVERHPGGGVALKSVSSNRYIQVSNTNENVGIKAKGGSKLAWEHFTWKSKGANKVALRSIHSGKWLQAAHSQNNTVLFPKGGSDLAWETFDWGEGNATGGNTGGDSGGNTGGATGGNTGGDTFFIVNRQTGKKLAPQNNNDGAELIQLDASNNTNIAKWTQVNTSNGYFYLKNVSTGKYFRPAVVTDGSKLEQRPTTFSGNFTQWKKVNSSNGYFYLQNRQTNLYFRPNTDATNSTMVQRPTSYAGNYTQWKFQNASAKALNSAIGKTSKLVAYPNPASDYVVITGTTDVTDTEIYTIGGVGPLPRFTRLESENSIRISFGEDLSAGTYVVRTGNGQSVLVVKE